LFEVTSNYKLCIFQFCLFLSISVKPLVVNTASEMTYTASSMASNSAYSFTHPRSIFHMTWGTGKEANSVSYIDVVIAVGC